MCTQLNPDRHIFIRKHVRRTGLSKRKKTYVQIIASQPTFSNVISSQQGNECNLYTMRPSDSDGTASEVFPIFTVQAGILLSFLYSRMVKFYVCQADYIILFTKRV